MSEPQKKNYLKTGLVIFILSVLINTVLMKANVGGLLREFSRLGVLVGLVLIVIGLIRKIFKSK